VSNPEDDDLTLDHPVALKFLPAGVATDANRLAQFTSSSESSAKCRTRRPKGLHGDC